MQLWILGLLFKILVSSTLAETSGQFTKLLHLLPARRTRTEWQQTSSYTAVQACSTQAASKTDNYKIYIQVILFLSVFRADTYS